VYEEETAIDKILLARHLLVSQVHSLPYLRFMIDGRRERVINLPLVPRFVL
jgi:hypothetical protein